MSVALHGNLRDFGIGEVFQLIGHQHKTGVLEVSGQGDRIRVCFEGGAVLRAERMGPYEDWALGDMLVRVGRLRPERLLEIEASRADEGRPLGERVRDDVDGATLDEVADLVTRETLFELLQRQRGSFHFTPGPVPHRGGSASALPAEQILMDGLRMVDEWRAQDDAARRDDTIFRRAGSFEAFRAEQLHESPARLAVAERLFLLIDGRLPVRRVVDLSRLGTFEAVRWLSTMRRAGLIEPLRAPAASPAGSDGDSQARRAPRAAVLAMLPFVWLVAMFALALRADPAPPARKLLEDDPVAGVESAADILRARRLLEAAAFASEPAAQEAAALRPAARGPLGLAPPAGRPYHTARRDGSHVLLPPAR